MINKIKDWFSDGYVKRKFFVYIAIFIFLMFVALAASYNIDAVLTHGTASWNVFKHLSALKNERVFKMFTILITAACMFIVYLIFAQSHLNYRGGSRKITPNITIPQAVNSSQYGSATFSNLSSHSDKFKSIPTSTIENNEELNEAGLYLGSSHKGSQTVYCANDDTHSIIIGTTGSGKTRCLVLQTLAMLGLAGESMIVADPKSELLLYSQEFLKSHGYNIVSLDFISFLKSNQYNFLQPIIDAVNANDLALAITRTNDLVAVLVGSDRTTESIWVDGERSIIACAIMAVVYDNRNKPRNQTLTNVYYFLANMCKPLPPMGAIPLTRYIIELDDNHPAKTLVAVSDIAPSKMRGSFYTSALTTLAMFTTPDIYSMTNMTDFDIYNTAKEKTAIFIILPDYKSTYYSIATLFVSQQYQMLRDEAYIYGGRLKRRVNYLLDEFGNFAKIPDFTKQITVGRGCGIRYHLFLQDFNQLKKVYGDDDAKIIRSNCEAWVYLHTQDPDTLKELSNKLGTYTMKSPSVSSSTNSASTSYNLTSRELLKPSEIEAIERPYQLIYSGGKQSVMYSPDISQTVFNALLGLGDVEHNRKLYIQRNNARKEREKITLEDIEIWKPWETGSKTTKEQ